VGCICYSTRGCIGRGQGLNRAAEWIARLQGNSWEVQGNSWEVQGNSWEVQGNSWEVQGKSGGKLG
jgi:hypothetical protein